MLLQLYERITRKLIRDGLSITLMESITSGFIASLITDTEGSSAVFKGSFVTYSNEAKIKCGVPKETIERFGVYSGETAQAMALACRKEYGADIGIGITGTAQNTDTSNADSVPGEVYYAIAYKDKVYGFFDKIEPQPTRNEFKRVAAGLVGEALEKLLALKH